MQLNHLSTLFFNPTLKKLNKKVLSVVVPVYFNGPSLIELYSRLVAVRGELLAIGIALEIIFVNDGSLDDSMERLLEIKGVDDSVRIIKLTRNFGSVHAIKAGFGLVSGDCFTILAADLQDPPELIVDMAQYWLKGSKFVICERYSRGDPLLSRFFSKIYYSLLRSIVIKDFPRGGFDMALMDRDLLPYMVKSSKSSYTVLLAFWLGYKPDIIKYHRGQRLHGKSKWTFSKKCTAFIDIMLGFSVTPIRAISAIGAAVSFFGFVYGAFVVIYALLGVNRVPGFPTLIALITFLLGLIILMLGIIGEYLWRIFDETNLRPESVIEKIY